MRKIKIISKTDKGKIALEKHIQESLTTKKKKKLMFKMLGFRQEIISQNPFILELELTNKVFQQLVKSEDIIRKIDEALIENGAVKEIDYIYEVEK